MRFSDRLLVLAIGAAILMIGAAIMVVLLGIAVIIALLMGYVFIKAEQKTMTNPDDTNMNKV